MAIAGRNQLIAVAALLLLAPTANAATVTYNSNLSVGSIVNEAQVILPGDELEFRYTALEDLSIVSFALSGTGTSSGGDVEDITFGFTSPGTNSFSSIVTVGNTASGGGFLGGLSLMAGDVFSIFFSDGISNPVPLTLSFQTDPPSAIPVPASGLFLASALAGFGVFASRKRRAKRREAVAA
jgi:hypothetical protein